MHENSHLPASGLASGHKNSSTDGKSNAADPQSSSHKTTINGATFDDSQAFSGLRKLQDSTKFDKARFSFRLYKR